MGGKRKITIQENAVKRIAETAFYIESELSEHYAKNFVDNVFSFLEKIARPEVSYRPCMFKDWQKLGYKCVIFNKKYVIAYLDYEDEVVIADFRHSALLK